jgi:amino acid adenylation domain-containing protein
MMKETITEPPLVTVESRPEMKVHPRQGSFLELFALQAKMRGTATAVQCGNKTLSYQELDRRSNQLAHHLRRLGVGPEVRVGVWLPRSMELVVALFGIIKAGGAYVPLDMNYPQERVNDMLADSQSSLLLALESTRAHLREFAGRTVLLDAESGQIACESQESPAVAIDPENLAYLIYTSGSTGRPKAVAIRHHSVSTLLSWVRKIFTDEELDGMVASTSICFDVSVFEIFGTLSWGGRAILVNNALDIPALKQTDRASLINVVPSAMAELLRAGDIPQSVKTVNLPGEPLSGALVRQVYQRKHVERAYNLYGPSEDTTFSTYELVRRDEPASIVPVGFPITNTELYILNDEMQPVPASEPGDVYIGGDGLARGYLNRSDLTAERFVPDGVSGRPGSRLYYTGDRGHFLPDGRLEYLGRVDHQVKIRGFRVELGEIEAVLNAHPQVEQAVVLARESTPDQKKLIAYVVADSGETVASGELRSYLQQKLPDYMVPAQFMFLEQLPLTPNGKVNRHALPMPDNMGSGAAPRTELEKTVVRALCGVLELPDVSLESTFLELGGSSLNATRAVAAIYEATSLRLPLASLFEKTLLEIEQELQAQMNLAQSEALQPCRRPASAGPVPAAYSQERIWFIQRMDPLATAYHFSARIRFIGRLNRAALEFALSKFLERHEIYRTTLSEVGGNLFQIVHDPWKVELEDINVEDDPALAARVFSQMHEPFDLTSLPLARWKLLRLSSNEHALLVVEHHVIHDGWSFNVFMGELTELYRSYDMGVSPRLDPSPFQFRDFAHWQREWMETHEARKQLDYWVKALAGMPPLLSLPYDYPRPAIQTYAGDLLRLQISDDLENQFPAAGRRNRVTMFMLFTAAMAVLLHRYSRQEDFCLGTGIANRRWTETKDLTGMLVNNIPLRMKITGDLTVAELLEQVRRTTLEAYACQDVPFDKIVQATNPVRHPSYNPIFQVMLGFHDSPLNCAPLGDTHLIVDQALANGSSKFDLNVVMVPPQNHNLPPGYRPFRELLWEYNSSLFSCATAQQMAAHFLHVLEGVVRDGLQTVSAIALLTEAEQQQILAGWNQTSRPYPTQCVHQLFEEQAEKTPAATATIYGLQQLTYAEVNRQANQLAHYLRKRGAGPESLIGIFMERSPQMIVALLAVLKAGAAYVPLDLTYPPERLCFMIKDAGLKIVLTGQELGADITGGQSGLQSIHLESERPRLTAESAANPGCLLNHTSLAYVMYTSGSTGLPKGIAIEHRNIVRLVRETDYVNLGPTDRIAQVANVSFDAATFEIWGAMLNGGCLVGIDKNVVLNPSELGRKIREENITAMFLTTALFNQIAREVKGAFAGVRYLCVGGEAVDPQHARLVLQDGPPRQLTNAYGPTETTTFSTWFVIEKVEERAVTVPIGRPLSNAQTYVLDEYLQPVPLGVTGELFIGGEGVGRGYLNRPELTAEKFIPHPFTNRPGERLYRTGDLVRQLRDGNLEFVGRIDHQIKIRGFRVELGEIEAVLAQFRGVKQCVVLLREDQPGEKKLVAYLVPDDGFLLDLAAVRTYLKTRLPDYMVPGACLDLPSLPLTANGKIDRQALPAPHYQSRTYCAPRTPQEEILCEIFSDVLAVPRVGIDDNFFDLGGHSLMATRLVSRVRSLLNAEVPLGVFFEFPTVAGLAEHLRGAEKARLALVRQERPERVPLSYAQQRLWFLDQLQGSSTEYNIVEALRLRGELDRKALEQALGTIVERHEVLRTHFVEMEGRPVQVITDRLPVRVMMEDLSGLGAAGQKQRLEAAMWQEREQPFDLGRGPLFRIRLLQLGEQEHVLLRTFHHIVSDGWSQGVFNGELTRLYEAFHQGEENPLEPLAVQYADFALWQRRWLEEGELVRELEYWKKQLQGISGQLELPRDHGRPGRQTFRAEMHRWVLGEEEVVEVKRAGQAGRATLYMTLLAGLAVLLGRYSGEEDLVVGTPIANRQEAQLEKMLGFFVNTLVLRMRVREEESFAELLGQVRETALEAYAHQDLPFERLVEELSPQRSLNTTPIYQVLFALQNAPVEMHKLTGLEVERIRGHRLTVRFDLELHAVEQDGGIEFNWIYNPDLFDRWRIEQMGRHYQTLLKAATKEPGFSLGSLEMLTAQEREQILTEWSHTACMALPEQVLRRLFGEQAHFALREPATIDGMRVYVLDREMRLVPAGVDGELYIGGPANGHHEYPNQIAELFVPDPFGAKDGNRLYHSGDLVRWRRDGNLELVGRAENHVKIRGYRVGLEEVEAALLQHPDVAEAAVLARDAESGGKRLVAYVVPQVREMGSGSLRNYLRDKLPGYMLPAQFHSLDALPKDATGKVDRPALLKVQTSSAESASAYIAPQTPLERSLAEIWRELLGLKRVGVDDNFFDVGGHSLLVIQLCAVLRQRLQVSLPIVDFFTYSTIRSLARHLDQMEEKPVSASDSKSRAERHREHLRRRAQASPRQPEKERIR